MACPRRRMTHYVCLFVFVISALLSGHNCLAANSGVATIVKKEKGKAQLDIGAKDGLRNGQRIVLFKTEIDTVYHTKTEAKITMSGKSPSYSRSVDTTGGTVYKRRGLIGKTEVQNTDENSAWIITGRLRSLPDDGSQIQWRKIPGGWGWCGFHRFFLSFGGGLMDAQDEPTFTDGWDDYSNGDYSQSLGNVASLSIGYSFTHYLDIYLSSGYSSITTSGLSYGYYGSSDTTEVSDDEMCIPAAAAFRVNLLPYGKLRPFAELGGFTLKVTDPEYIGLLTGAGAALTLTPTISLVGKAEAIFPISDYAGAELGMIYSVGVSLEFNLGGK